VFSYVTPVGSPYGTSETLWGGKHMHGFCA
jgi:hypothetical protein